MKYYLLEISTGDAQIAGKAVYEYDSEKDVIASFHSKMGVAMKSDLYDSELVMAIDENGVIIKRERYTKPIKE